MADGAGSPAYLVGLLLAGRRVVVVGAGRVAARRVPRLIEAGAVVEVIAPAVRPDLQALADCRVVLGGPAACDRLTGRHQEFPIDRVAGGR